jgi:hypothetical protein
MKSQFWKFGLAIQLMIMAGCSSLSAAPLEPLAAPSKAFGIKGGAVLNLGPSTSPEYPFINLMQAAGGFTSPNNFAFPSILNANGYPVSGSLPQDISGVVSMPAEFTDSSTRWVLEWRGTVGTSARPGIQLLGGVREIGSSGCVSGATTYNLSVFGTDCQIEFTFAVPRTGGSIPFKFLAGAAFNGSLGKLSLYRKSHQAAYRAGEIFNPDFVSTLQLLKPRAIRTLNWSLANISNIANAAQQAPATALGFGPRWDPNVWAGTASGIDTYSATLPGVSALVDGLTVQVQFANSNTAATTFNLNGLGAFPIANLAAAPISAANSIVANSLWTLIYDAALKKWLGNRGPLNAGIPFSVQTALANKVNADLWLNVPTHATDAFVAAIATTQRDTLNINLNTWYEYSNEIWNFNDFAFPQTNYAVSRGAALGFPAANNERLLGFYALRVRQIMGNVTAVYGAKMNYKRVLAYQATGNVQTTQKWRMEGFDLNGALYPAYCAAVGGNFSSGVCTGDPKYNTFPNRPIDHTDVLAYATYYSGAQLKNVSSNYVNTMTSDGPSGYAVGLLGAANDYATGLSENVSRALTWVDWDLRRGTVNGTPGPATLLAFASGKNIGSGPIGVYPTWEAIAASYDRARPPGVSNLFVANYEGGLESIAPVTAKCTSLGISTSYCGTGGKIDNLLAGYKKSALFQQLATDQFDQFLAQPHSLATSWYQIANGDQWSLFPGNMSSAPFTSFNAFQALRR